MALHPFRRVLAVTAAALCAAAVAVTTPASAADVTLGSAAAATGRYFGAAVQERLLTETPYTTILNREFTSVTPELEMWWNVIQPTRNAWNFGPADRVVEYAQAHGMRVRGRLITSYGLPAWVNGLPTASDVNAALVTFIRTVMTRYHGKIDTWDVVGEAFSDNASATRRPGIFQSRLGDSWIEQAFRAARAADPEVRLCYNDYGIEDIDKRKSQAVFGLLRDFRSRGVPVDCVGLESHFTGSFPYPANFRRTLETFASLGLDVHLTELDVAGTAPAQGETYRSAISSCVAVPRCKGITVFGVSDQHSWRSSETPLLFDRYYNKKPSYYAALSAFPMPVTGTTP